MGDPIWISTDLATAIHRRQLAEHGGADGVRDPGLLKSAIGRPRNSFAYTDPTPSVPALAASYAFCIARYHAIIDGNKRTAYVVCRVSLILNGLDFTAGLYERYHIFLALAAGEKTEAELAELAEWLAANTRPAAG